MSCRCVATLFRTTPAPLTKDGKQDPKDHSKVEVLGTLRDPILARQLFLSYLSDTGSISEELRKSVANGFAGEAR